MDRLNDIRLFLDAAQLGGFSAAGRKHGLSPAAASACILRMEAALGIKLFERTTRRLRLTDEGEQYRQACQIALDTLSDAELALQEGRATVRGTVRISAPSDLGRNRLLDYLSEFQQQYPEIKFSLSLSDTNANLVGDEIDLAIRYGQLPDSTMAARLLATNHRVVCASPSLLERVGVPARPRDLATLPTLVLVTGGGPMHEWKYAGPEGPNVLRVTHHQTTNDGDVLRKWALQGRGFALKSRIDIADDLAAGRLVTVLSDYFAEPAPLNALYHRSTLMPARLRYLIDHLTARFAAM
ncbi:MAG: LysR family transcriptional regulator [Burkholderiales bacterium]|nr:LysR family transcriptional regulator [Burkholderiales bacterium]